MKKREEELVRLNNEVQCFADLQGLELDELGNQIIYHKGKMAQNIIEIGARLIVAKTKVKHGEWGQWLEDEVEISQRTANNWMKVAKEFSDSQAITNLEGTKVVMLLDVPVDMRDQFIEENDIKNMTTRQMKQAIKDMKNTSSEVEEDHGIYEANVEDLKDFPNHQKYFPNLVGEKWMSFLESIKRNGVIETVHITRDNMIVSGHQRVRACRDLGIEKVPVTYFHYNKDSKLTYDEQLKHRFCGGNCMMGSMELYSNAMIMLGLKEGIARNPKDIMEEQKRLQALQIYETEGAAYSIVRLGEELIELKDDLSEKEYESFLLKELQMTITGARKYIDIAKQYPNSHSLSKEDQDNIINKYLEY